jgi:hypothetical protein
MRAGGWPARLALISMATEALADRSAAPAEHTAPNPAQGWRDDIWAMVVGALDAILRSCYGVTEFTDNRQCVLRLGQSQAKAPVLLADGTAISAGETVGTVHFWNEQLPPFSRSGPDLRWAVVMRQRVVRSLEELACFIEEDAGWRGVQAFRAEAALSSRIGNAQLRRVAQRYGFECVTGEASWLRHVHDLGECFSAWGLARAYNPAALPRQRFFRNYHDLWISRYALIERYGRHDPAGLAAGLRGERRISCRPL